MNQKRYIDQSEAVLMLYWTRGYVHLRYIMDSSQARSAISPAPRIRSEVFNEDDHQTNQ